MGNVIVVQTIIDLLIRVFGPNFAKDVFTFLMAKLPNLTAEERAELDAHYADYVGWKF